MVGFYSIRKLIEAKKLNDNMSNMKVQLQSYPGKGKPVALLNWDEIDRLDNLRRGAKMDIL